MPGANPRVESSKQLQDADRQATVDVQAPGIHLRSVRCDVWFAKTPGAVTRIRLHPTPTQFVELKEVEHCSLASTPDPGIVPPETLFARHVYLETFADRTPQVAAPTVTGFGLELIRLTPPRASDEHRPGNIRCWLSSVNGLAPPLVRTLDYKGAVTVGRNGAPIQVAVDGRDLEFDYTFRYRDGDDGTIEQIPILTLHGDFPSGAYDFNSLTKSFVPAIDRLLAIVSFALRRHTRCYRVQWLGQGGRVTWDRGDRFVPAYPNDAPAGTPLVVRDAFTAFLGQANQSLATENQVAPLLRAMNAVTPNPHEAIEQAYLDAYGALEACVDWHVANAPCAESQQASNAWPALHRELVKTFDAWTASPHAANAHRPERLRNRIDRLNAPDFSDKFQRIIAAKNIPTDDLWPVFGRDRDPSLSRLRNRLAHGSTVDGGPSLFVALEHLRRLVERMILSAIRWDGERSDAGPSAVAKHPGLGWKPHWATLSRAELSDSSPS